MIVSMLFIRNIIRGDMVIFLDCDGVVNSLGDKIIVKDSCIKILGKIVKDYTAKVVLVSTWRFGFLHDYSRCTPQIQELRSKCKNYGFDIYSRTKNLNNRSEEILTYIKEHEIDKFIILDDDKSEYTKIFNENYWVNGNTGLTIKDYNRIKKFLN